MHDDTGIARNLWSRPPKGGDWPLVRDLGRDLLSPAWWRGGFMLCGGILAAVALGFGLPVPDRPAGPERVAEAPGAALGAVFTARLAEATDPPTDESFPEPAAPQAPAPLPESRQVALGRGDTLSDAVLRVGVSRRDAHEAIAAFGDLLDPRRLQVGQAVNLVLADDEGAPRLERLALRTGHDRRIVAERGEDGAFLAGEERLPTTRLLAFASGTIDDSLYLTAERAGVPAQVIVELIRLYSFDVDFQREIRPGDRFELLYERVVAEDDGRIEDGAILFAKLGLGDRELPLWRHRTVDEGEVDYFNAEGASVRKALMRTPLDGARLTSRFGKRKHPVLGYVRSHQGADFGAPTGTPVYAAGNGVIERASVWGSYGNYVRIRHNDTYKTAYAHLSKYGRGIRQGVRVRQGQIIGYVGATGRVTAAHLHYEVLVEDKRVDPLKLDLPSGRKLTGPALAAFVEERDARDADRNALAHAGLVALASYPGQAP